MKHPNQNRTLRAASFQLLCLLILQSIFSGAVAHAANSCSGLFFQQKITTPNALLTSAFDHSEILAIGINDHSHFEPFDQLADLIRSRGLDPLLKTIVIEDSSLRAALYNELSVNEVPFANFKQRAMSVYAMFGPHEIALFEKVLPVVREINKQRPLDPLLVTSIDGMNNEKALEVFAKPPEQTYATSFRREQDTALNFARTFVRGRKTIVAYQAAHVVKNLSGRDFADGKLHPLSWLSLATSLLKISPDDVHVSVVDSLGDWSPNGVLKLPDGVSRTLKAKAFEWQAHGIETFKPGTFLRNYKSGTVEVIDATKPVFDGVILEP